MARPAISAPDLERVKREVSCAGLIEAAGVTLSRHGKDLIGRCPLHDDRTPSLVVTPAKNLWHCLGACQRGGGPIDWVMAREGLAFREAAERLLQTLQPAAELAPSTSDGELLEAVTRYYERRLEAVPDAQAYLKSRGLDDAELLKHFRVGYADRTLGTRLPSRTTEAGKALREQLQRLGVVRKSGHEHLAGCLTVPIFDEQGQASELYGRRVTTTPGNAPTHLYLPGPHRGVLNGEALRKAKPERVVVTEALLDAMSFWAAGHRNVTSAYGTEGVTDELVALLTAPHVKEVLIAFDADAAGDGAASKLARRLEERGVAARRVVFPSGTDANDHFLEHGKAGLDDVLERALPMNATPGAKLAPKKDKEPTSLAAQAVPTPAVTVEAAPKATVEVKESVQGEEVHIELGRGEKAERRYRVRGLSKNRSFDVLRVNLLVTFGRGCFVDSLDLYRAKDRQGFIRGAKDELHLDVALLKKDLGQVLLILEELQHKRLADEMKPKEPKELTLKEREDALELLRDPSLPARIERDLTALGLVGEETGKLIGYLAATSRKLEKPLAVLIQSSSSAGKSSLMDAVLSLMPEEDVAQYSALTPQALYYMAEEGLSHRVLALSEDEGAERAAYPLKLLQSEGKLSIASTQKDEATGRLLTESITVKGPVMLFLTTTSAFVDEELENRCLLLSVSEDRAQTEAIHASQRKRRTLEGLSRHLLKERIQAVHRNAQRLLQPLAVVNPYAEQLTFRSTRTRTRRDHEKYLTLIDAIALLHQHQREQKVLKVGSDEAAYIEVHPSDIDLAGRLFADVYGRSSDELPPHTERLLRSLSTLVDDLAQKEELERTEVRFSRRQALEHAGVGLSQLRVHLERLVEHELVLVHRGRRGQGYVYELAWQPDEPAPGPLGLISPADLAGAPGNLAGVAGQVGGGVAGPWRAPSGSRIAREIERLPEKVAARATPRPAPKNGAAVPALHPPTEAR